MRRISLAACVRTISSIGIAVTLAGCGSHEPLQAVLTARCTPISGTQPVDLRITAPTAGTLRIGVEQRGVSVIATLASSGASKRAWSLSARPPIERFGVATFTPDVQKDEPIAVSIRSRDSPDIVGEVCISADRLPADEHRLRAERDFAAGSQAVEAEEWQRAFDFYLAAANEFRDLDAWRAAQARHAMAEIAYSELRKDEGAYVLAGWALADFGPRADADLRSRLLMLQARATLESQRLSPDVRRKRVFELLGISETLARQARFGEREVPRFDILRGFAEFRTGRTSEAGALFTRAAQRCTELRDWECDAIARQNIATLAEEARDYPVALQTYHDVLTRLPPDLQPRLSALIWGNYGRLQAKAGLFRQAELSHRASVRLYANAADCEGTRMNVARLGTLLVQVGGIGEGHGYLTRAASLDCPKLIAEAKSASSVDSTNTAEPTDGAPDEAACPDTPDGEALSEGGRIAVFNALLGLIDASRLENDSSRALRCLTTARPYAITPRTKLRLANAEGATLLERREPVKARVAFERGLAIADGANLPPTHENRSLAYLGLARAELLDAHPAKARDHAAQALRLSGSRADLAQVVASLQLLAQSFRAEKANDAATSVLRVAASLIEQVPIDELDAEQRATWLATQHAVFAEMTALFASDVGNDEARAWDAFEASERGRARSFRYAMSQATDTRATSSSEPASVRYRDLLRQIADLAKTYSAKGAPIPLETLAKLAESRSVLDSSTRDALKKRLASLDATVVEYAAAGDDMFAFVIDEEHIHVVRLGSRSDITSAATALYERVRNPESALSDVQNAARRLAALTLWPLADLVKRRRLIIVPDDALHTVPFAVLPWNRDGDAVLTVERIELAVMPSTLFVTRQDAEHALHPAAPRLELIGDPVFGAADWLRECQRHRVETSTTAGVSARATTRSMGALPRLPGSRKELTAIIELAHRHSPNTRVREHVGCQATPQALRAAAATNPTLLHIATHGYVNAYRPRLSALALTPEMSSNGAPATFGLLDILQMKIDSRLVVLSACDTSRGKLLPGEGVLGPAQAFLQAGAASVIASYWRVADEETAPFMRTFYRYLLVEHLSAAQALRQTQIDYVRQGGPYHWAAFTLFGQPDTQL